MLLKNAEMDWLPLEFGKYEPEIEAPEGWADDMYDNVAVTDASTGYEKSRALKRMARKVYGRPFSLLNIDERAKVWEMCGLHGFPYPKSHTTRKEG